VRLYLISCALVMGLLAIGWLADWMGGVFTFKGATDYEILVLMPLTFLKVFWHRLIWTLYPFLPMAALLTYRELSNGIPRFFRDRKAAREDEAKRREDIPREYWAMVERNKRAAATAKLAEIERDKAEQNERVQRIRAYVQRRREAVAEVEQEILVEVARAKQEVMRTNDQRPDAPVMVVRKWMQDTQPKPKKWGFLNESENMTVRRILVNSGGWLPPSPPHPPGLDPGSINPSLLL